LQGGGAPWLQSYVNKKHEAHPGAAKVSADRH
jgi:hypothetical protein